MTGERSEREHLCMKWGYWRSQDPDTVKLRRFGIKVAGPCKRRAGHEGEEHSLDPEPDEFMERVADRMGLSQGGHRRGDDIGRSTTPEDGFVANLKGDDIGSSPGGER